MSAKFEEFGLIEKVLKNNLNLTELQICNICIICIICKIRRIWINIKGSKKQLKSDRVTNLQHLHNLDNLHSMQFYLVLNL